MRSIALVTMVFLPGTFFAVPALLVVPLYVLNDSDFYSQYSQ